MPLQNPLLAQEALVDEEKVELARAVSLEAVAQFHRRRLQMNHLIS